MNKAGIKRNRNWNLPNVINSNEGKFENLEKQLKNLMLNDGDNYSSVNTAPVNTSSKFRNTFYPLKNSRNKYNIRINNSKTRKLTFDPLVRIRNINSEGKSKRVGNRMNTRTKRVFNKTPVNFPYSEHHSNIAQFAARIYGESNNLQNAIQKIESYTMTAKDKKYIIKYLRQKYNVKKENI